MVSEEGIGWFVCCRVMMSLFGQRERERVERTESDSESKFLEIDRSK